MNEASSHDATRPAKKHGWAWFIGGLAAVVVIMVLLVQAVRSQRVNTRRMESVTRARGIHQVCVQYAQGNNGQFPPDLATLYRLNYISADFVLSPWSNKKRLPEGFESWSVQEQDDWINANSSYVIVPQPDRDQTSIAVYLKPEDSDGHGIPVCSTDNHCTWEPVSVLSELDDRRQE